MANKVRKKEWVIEEADLKPFMNLMVVLIPMLLLSAEFAKIAIISIKLPEARGSQTNTKVTKRPQKDESNKLLLTAIITDSVVTLGAKSGFLPSVFYQEYDHYIAKDDQADFTVKYEPGKEVKHPKTGRIMEPYEKYDIYLYACKDDYSELLKCLYSKNNEMVTNSKKEPITSVNAGDTVYTVTNPRRLLVVTNPADFELRPLSVYDELENRLMKVKERFADAEDGEDIIIAAENQVIYDKIVQIMDAAKLAGFPNISIAKLRG